jgi:superfamily I DNA and/or RNA helicase
MRRALRTIRLGHPARIKASILKYSLEAAVQNADGTEIVTDIRKELQSFLRVLSNQKSKPNDRRVAYREMKALRKEIRTREEKVVQELLASAQVVLATTVGASSRLLGKIENGFDLVVIDEAAQALEASCWIPILNGRKVVLAGDHCQLPPTIKARHQRAQVGLSKTMFERLMQLYGDDRYGKEMPRISRMLRVQYRMHHDIADWASQAMYGGELQTHESVREQTLSQLEAIGKLAMDEELAETRLLLVDTAGCEYFETMNMAGSRFNEGEASIVVQHARKLIGMGLDQSQLAIITPYNGQVELLRSLLLHDFPRLEIRSVDGFQGGEREAVILSLVRSSDRGGKEGIGFLRGASTSKILIFNPQNLHLT